MREEIIHYIFEEERKTRPKEASRNYEKNILVVDDSALMRRVICDIINSEGTFQATDVCRDGLEAYDKINEEPV